MPISRLAPQNGQKRQSFCPFLCFILLLPHLFAAQAACAAEPLWLLLEDKDGKAIFAAPMREGGQFVIRYRHSVAQTPVMDYFKIKNGEIWLDRTVYQDFGAGLPHAPEAGQKMEQRNGQLMISGYERRLPVFHLRVGRVAEHQLLLLDKDNLDVATKQIPLDSLVSPGSPITFSICREQPHVD